MTVPPMYPTSLKWTVVAGLVTTKDDAQHARNTAPKTALQAEYPSIPPLGESATAFLGLGCAKILQAGQAES